MASKQILLSVFKFLTGETDHVCRLCFGFTESEYVSLNDIMTLNKPYIEDSLTLADIFKRLGLTLESSLPKLMCTNCATMAITAYLFQKLCEYSSQNWNKALKALEQTLNKSDKIGSQVKSIYLSVSNKENVLFTSKKTYEKDKKKAVCRIKLITKSRQTYRNIKIQPSNIICEECGMRFHSNNQLIRHMRVHRKASYNCPQCLKVFNTQVQLEEHAERIHYPKKIPCLKCTKKFSTKRMLRDHIKLHHTAAACKLCSIQLPSKRELRIHLDKHDVLKCSQCDKSFMNKYTYKFHLKICGNKDNRVPSFFCDICHKGYIRKNSLRTHLKVEHGFGKLLSCNWCSKKFDAESRLRNHIVKHTKERNFHCEHCGNKFVTQAALVYHIRLHTGEKPYQCQLCNQSFLSASRRMEHIRRKHIAPSKECPICNVKFVTGSRLHKHVQRHYDPRSRLYVPISEQTLDQTLKTDFVTSIHIAYPLINEPP